VDILHVSAGTTSGWRVIDETLRSGLEELGISVERVAIRRPSGGLAVRIGSPSNDLYEAASLVAAAERGLRRVSPRAIIYSSSHAALLQPRRELPEAVWVDGPIACMSPGPRGAPIRALERTRQRRLDLAMSMSVQYATQLVRPLCARASTVLHVPIEPSDAEAEVPRGVTAPFGIMYGGNPGKKGLALAIDSWHRSASDMRLVVSGITRDRAIAHLGTIPPREIEFVGPVSRTVHRGLVRRALVYVSASCREEYGTAQLEALADGVPLAAVPSRGAAEPVAIARRLRPTLVAKDISAEGLAACITRATSMSHDELSRYRTQSSEIMAAYSYGSFRERLRADVLPVLLENGSPD
jgi:Glycosyl transferases group 1